MSPERLHRLAHMLSLRGVPLLPRALEAVIFLMFHSVIPAAATIGPGTKFAYKGLGVVVHRDAVIGCDVLIGPGVVVGGRSGLKGLPIIGNGVFVGAGAKILGPISVGDGAVIGANAVVIQDVAPGAVVVGIPARPIKDTVGREQT